MATKKTAKKAARRAAAKPLVNRKASMEEHRRQIADLAHAGTRMVTFRPSVDLYARVTLAFGGGGKSLTDSICAALESGLGHATTARRMERALEGLYEENAEKRAKLRRDLERELRTPGVGA